MSNLLYWVKKGEKIIVGVISGYGQDTLAGASYTCYIDYHPGTLIRDFIIRPIFGYSKGEPLRLETLTLFRTTQNPTIYTLFRAIPSMFLNNTIFSTKTHVPAPRYGQYLMHAHNHITPVVAATFSWKISGSRLLWTVSSSLGCIRRYMTPALYASGFIDKHRLQAPLILMSILSGKKKGKEDKTLRSEFSSIFLLFIFSNRESCRASIEIDTGSGIGFWASSKSGGPACKSVNYILGKLSGASNDGFLLNALNSPFRLSRVLLDL